MKNTLPILQSGYTYFFLRPKVEHEDIKGNEDVQEAALVINPENTSKYFMLIIGKKHLPEDKGEVYLVFVDKIFSSYEDLTEKLNSQEYQTKTLGKRHVSAMKCAGYGRYAIFFYNDHSYFAYKLISPKKIKKTQAIFNLKDKDTFLIQIKNTNKNPSLTQKSKEPKFPKKLEEQFMGKKFIPLNSAEYLNYESAEMLFIKNKYRIPKEFISYIEDIKEEESEIYQRFS